MDIAPRMAAPPPPPAAAPAPATTSAAQLAPRTKSKAYQTTIAAEADDLKYESKYKELKKKVKEVEEDNEQLYVKILQAQQSIQRLRLERALIYDRLSTLAPPPAAPPAPSQSHGHPTTDDGSHHHSHPNSSNPGAGGSGGGGGGGGSGAGGGTSGGHHPHPLSQSFTASSIGHRDMERDVPTSNGLHPISDTIPLPPPPPSSNSQPQPQPLPAPSSSSSTSAAAFGYSPTRGASSREDAHMHIPHHPKPREKTNVLSSGSILPPISSAVGGGGGGGGGGFADGRAYHPLPQSGERRHSPVPGGY